MQYAKDGAANCIYNSDCLSLPSTEEALAFSTRSGMALKSSLAALIELAKSWSTTLCMLFSCSVTLGNYSKIKIKILSAKKPF